MAKTKIYKDTWARTPNAFYVSAMRTTDNNNAAVECANQQWQQATALFHTTFMTLDNAYQRSMVSFSTQTIAEKDEERDQWGQVIEQVAKQWMRMPDPAMAIELKAAREKMDEVYADYVELTNALIVTGTRRTAWTRRRSTRWWRWTARPLAKSCLLSRSKYSVKNEQ